jgi:hypothetical protein
MGWKADYVTLFDEQKGVIDVQGWVTLTNQTGTTFEGADTLLVAGNVAQSGQQQYYDIRQRRMMGGYPPPPPPPPPPGNRLGVETPGRESLGEFYLYPLKERTTIANQQTKQVSFLDVTGAAARRAFVFRNGWLQTQDQASSASSVLQFSSSRNAGLGDALPAGTVRVYMKDARGNAQFVGENQIGHTPMGSDIAIATGEAFDVKVQPVMEQRERVNDSRWRTRMRYTLTNASPRAVTVDLIRAACRATRASPRRARRAAAARPMKRCGASTFRPMAKPPSPPPSTRATKAGVMLSRRAALGFIAMMLAAAPAAAQTIATSRGPDQVGVTVYRAPFRPPSERINLQWLNGFALITETRRVSIPAGEVDIRFEGVAGGILPESAIVTGLPSGVVEKNQDAYLLSPGSLVDASLGRRVHLRRTSRATGAVREVEAVVRSSAQGGVVLETEAGIEALRCTGLAETVIYDRVPPKLAAKPTLSVRVRSERPAEATVTLSYLASGFDWQANYVAQLSPDGKRMDLFAWLTLANADETGFRNANTNAVAGRLNRSFNGGMRPRAEPLRLECWPMGTTSDVLQSMPISAVGGEEIVVTGSRIARADLASAPPPPPPPPPPPMMAQQEELGDLKLYRIPEPVTVAAKSQKQVAFLDRNGVKVESLYRQRIYVQDTSPRPVMRVITTRNRTAEGLVFPFRRAAWSFSQRARRGRC